MLKLLAVGWGAKNVVRYYDILHPAPIDRRSSTEIISDITARAGLKVVTHNGRNVPDGDTGN